MPYNLLLHLQQKVVGGWTFSKQTVARARTQSGPSAQPLVRAPRRPEGGAKSMASTQTMLGPSPGFSRTGFQRRPLSFAFICGFCRLGTA